MPGFDHKGPTGAGPRTGRQRGKCRPKNTDIETENEMNESEMIADTEEVRGLGRGGIPYGCGMGFAGGRRRGRRAARGGFGMGLGRGNRTGGFRMRRGQ